MSGPPKGRGSRITQLPNMENLGKTSDLSYFNNRTIRTNTMATMASQGRGLIPKTSDINGGLHQLKKQAEKMGLTPEIKELTSEVDELSELIQRKNYELTILEAFAMESPDENVTELRNQLFLTVKLIHSEEIEILLKDADMEKRFTNHGYHDSDVKMHHDQSREFKDSLFSRIRGAYNKRKALKKEIKSLKEHFKRRQENPSEDVQCESSR